MSQNKKSGKSRGKSKAELEAELRFVRQSRVLEGVTSTVQASIRWGSLVVIAYFAYQTVVALAGRYTLANIDFSLFASWPAALTIGWLFGIAGTIYGLQQRSLRQLTVERLQSRITELETARDPQRSSSRLTARGNTRPEDKLC